MAAMFSVPLVFLLAYLVGSIPFGYVTALLVRRIDIREHGSRNIGATNIGRVLGTRWGILVLFLDLLKGFLPVRLLPAVFPGSWPEPHLAVVAGFGAILGHVFPCWLGFRGGKGVATALGVAASLAPWCTLSAFTVFVLVFLVTHTISLCSILAAITFFAAHLVQVWPNVLSPAQIPLTLFSLAIPLLIIWRHRTNLVRILNGTEPRYRSGESNRKSAE